MKSYRYEVRQIPLSQEELLLKETIFHTANGYIGIRSCFEEGYPSEMQTIRGTYINGFYDFARMEQAEKLRGLIEEKQTILNIADTQTIKLIVDGEAFSMFEGTVEKSSRVLDMRKGYAERSVLWTSPGGKKVEIAIRRMASFVWLPLFLIEYSARAVNFAGKIRFESLHSGEAENYFNPSDPRVAAERAKYLEPARREKIGDATYLESKTVSSGLFVGSAVCHRLSKNARIETSAGERHEYAAVIEADIAEGESVALLKYSVFADSIREADCKAAAAKLMETLTALPPSQLYQAQEKYLDQYWKRNMVEIKGDDDLNLAVHYNMYQLLQSVGKDRFCNIAAKGLSGEGYEGHYFWDTEMYIQPCFLLTSPEIVKNLISYRYTTLERARENARILGHEKGALYPWRTIMGKECSGYYVSGSAAYHINGDIAYSIIAYYLATKDLAFIAEKGLEILVETARLWMDAGNWQDGAFQIHEVTGPDEYTCMVSNNYFTNALAKHHLYWTAKFCEMLPSQKLSSREELAEFRKASEGMFLPYDEKLGINPQDDSFLKKKAWDLPKTPRENFPLLLHYHPLYLYRHQVCKQADTVMAHFILEDMQSLETMENSFLYYEKITTHDSSLSTAIFSIMASKLGMKQKACEYFGDSAKLDLFDTHRNTKDGIHTANMGGNYMAIVYGFGGVRIKENGLHLTPWLPEQWDGYEFKIAYQNALLHVRVDKQGCKVRHEEGAKVEFYLRGRKIAVKAMEEAQAPLSSNW